ncbi:MAG: hypothetical protein AAGC88_01315 [Bacteroidota bacterium]
MKRNVVFIVATISLLAAFFLQKQGFDSMTYYIGYTTGALLMVYHYLSGIKSGS